MIIGLTGGIASGKSTVAALFKELGVEIISADTIAREITAKGEPALQKIVNHFGKTILDKEGNLERAHLRKLIFASNNERLWLNNLLHPLIRKEIEKRSIKARDTYLIVEIPLLNNPKDYPYLDKILVVVADEQIQVNRILNRDKGSLTEAKAIIASQMTNEQRLAFSSDVIYNNGSLQKLKNEVKKLHKKYLSGK
ncbi:MAG: dephospho-CoA kinase [Proteobacteria bacterium]|nr:dephospho-CoA kinase [Pseudomonadota bacterium]